MSPIVKALQFLFDLRLKGQNVEEIDNVIDRLDECMTEEEHDEYLTAQRGTQCTLSKVTRAAQSQSVGV